MNYRRAILIQTLIEAIIPVLGYFFWNWDATFILLFYLLDWLLFIGLTIAKARKRFSYSGQDAERKDAIKYIILGITALLMTCNLVFLTLSNLIPHFNLQERFIAFLTYKDMGIQQGLVLIPIMVLNGVLLYKQQFITPARFRTMIMRQIVKPAVQEGVWLFFGAAAALLLSLVWHYPTEILIGLTIVGTSAYRFLVVRS